MTTTCPRPGARPLSVATNGVAVGLGLVDGGDEETEGVGAAVCFPPPEHAASVATAPAARTTDMRDRCEDSLISTPALRLGEQLVHRAAAKTAGVHLEVGELAQQRRQRRQLARDGIHVLRVDLDPCAIADVTHAQVAHRYVRLVQRRTQ